MTTVSFLSQKGGSGKSTTAAALAVAARQRGLKVVILDTDPQASLCRWGKRRGETDEFVSRAAPEGELVDLYEKAQNGGADLIIIDTQGAANSAAVRAAKLSDVVLIPSPTHRVDMETLESSKAMVDSARKGDAAYVVFTKVAHHDIADLPDAETVAGRKYGLECAPVWIGLRKAYGRGLDTNLSPQEIERDGKAAAEINALLDFVYNSTTKTVKKKRA